MTDPKIKIDHTPNHRIEVPGKFPGSQEHRRLQQLVSTMALEIENLNEETKQLRAAVLMYREVVRRTQEVAFLQQQNHQPDAFMKEQATSLDHVSPVMRVACQ